tara:strand:- start:410 stop:805 length:396 start_codon:yes stop_codon:yes gene_type:complete
MPHLQFEISKKVDIKNKKNFIRKVKEVFSQIMQTGSDHIAISLRENSRHSIELGRVSKNDDICLINLDIRKGRSKEQKRCLVKEFILLVNKNFDIKKENQYITITEHKGSDFNLFEKSLEAWKKNDKPLDK